jgi:hypothetical protein
MMACREIGQLLLEERWIDSGEAIVSMQKLFNLAGK